MLLFYRNYAVQNSSYQKERFLTGTFPSPLPDGFYKGHIPFLDTPWQGKIFDSSSSSGTNKISGKDLFPFKTSKAQGLVDKNLTVLKIDYNLPQNPFYLRILEDDLVQNAPWLYTGKVFIKLIPNFPLSLGFFQLER